MKAVKNQKENVGLELRKLKVATRNKVRAIAFSGESDGIDTLNYLRLNCSIGELIQVEKTINLLSDDKKILPQRFPTSPQTSENYSRLCTLPIEKQLQLLDTLVRYDFNKLMPLLKYVQELNDSICQFKFDEADDLFGKIISKFGFSHLILRKAILVKSFAPDNCNLKNSDEIIEKSGLKDNNPMVSSLVHCFQEEQDFLSIKRSMMGTINRGKWNRFSRDMLRVAFHPHAKDDSDLSKLLQSNLQSSLIDSVILAKINVHLIERGKYYHLEKLFSLIDKASSPLEQIIEMYVDYKDPENLFYQHSSAWYENHEIIKYRVLQDHFYDSPDSEYFSINSALITRISNWVAVNKIGDLIQDKKLTTHKFNRLHQMEKSGTITRSSIFNYIVYVTSGETYASEHELIELMSCSSALSRTIHISFLKTLALHTDSDISKIVLYLLVARKSKNEMDSFKLRKIMQKRVIAKHDGKLEGFLYDMESRSAAIARYTYDVCTEDFIAKLSHIIKTAQAITETRAKLHIWMGKHTGENSYNERARNLIIDHQINLVKDELNDHRIYVDTARFTEWMEDEVGQQLSTLLLILEHTDELNSANDQQLFSILEQCYYEFCTNKFFGIASYLGRRIRHGTFKGHLYSDVISIEDNKKILQDTAISNKWAQWKETYEKKIDLIVKEKIHIETSKKRDGFLNPNIKSTQKHSVAIACLKDILNDFIKNRQTYGSFQLIVEYCWRLAEIDLRSMNSYLKNQKQSLLNSPLIVDSNCNSFSRNQIEARDFSRLLQRQINDKLVVMYSWFQRPQSVAPKASLGLLFKAVVAEVRTTFKHFTPDANIKENDDIEMMGGAYHILYDALYVIIYNAAKHGKRDGVFSRDFNVSSIGKQHSIVISISSEVQLYNSDEYINSKLHVSSSDDIANAQLQETRSGIRKLYHFQAYDKNFTIEKVNCKDGMVTLTFSYKLGHS